MHLIPLYDSRRRSTLHRLGHGLKKCAQTLCTQVPLPGELGARNRYCILTPRRRGDDSLCDVRDADGARARSAEPTPNGAACPVADAPLDRDANAAANVVTTISTTPAGTQLFVFTTGLRRGLGVGGG